MEKTNIRIILFLSLIVAFQSASKAQEADSGFLYQIGTPDSIYSEILMEQREIFVQVPPGYKTAPDRKYPTVYVLDGEVFLPMVQTVLDFYSGGYMPEMVIVGISNRQNRTRDLTTSKVSTMGGMPFNQENGEADQFMAFMEHELIPYMEKKYPVTSYRTLIGHSYGGLFTIYALQEKSNLFENYLSIDPSLDWDDQRLLKESPNQLQKEVLRGKSLYMSLSGQLHMQDPAVTIDNVMDDESDFTLFARSNIEFRQLVEQNKDNGLLTKWEFFENDLHGTVPFPSIRNGLISIFQWFQMENTNKFNSPETSANELKTIIDYRSSKLQDHFKYEVPPYPEDLLNTLGYMSMDMGQMEKSKMFFDCTIKYYPGSANAYDSMGDFFERQEDYTNALKYVRKAFEISGSDYHHERMMKLNEMVKED